MKRVTGIGGIFFKARDPQALAAWYREHLGFDILDWGGAAFRWAGPDNPQGTGTTIWSPLPADSDCFAASPAPFVLNLRVADLQALLAALRAEGCAVDAKEDASEYGRFGWVMDPEGNRLELWEPPPGQ